MEEGCYSCHGNQTYLDNYMYVPRVMPHEMAVPSLEGDNTYCMGTYGWEEGNGNVGIYWVTKACKQFQMNWCLMKHCKWCAKLIIPHMCMCTHTKTVSCASNNLLAISAW